MALLRKTLEDWGIDEEISTKIIKAHSETVDGLKAQINELKADLEKAAEVKKTLDSYEIKYNALKDEFKEFKTNQAKKEEKTAKQNAYRDLLKKAGISEKRLDTVLKVSDIDSVELEKDGKIKNADELTTRLKDEWSDFIITESKQGANTPHPPVAVQNVAKSKSEIMQIKDTVERQKAWGEYLAAQQKG